MTPRQPGLLAGALVLTTIVWIGIRLVLPQFDYYPPEVLFGIFERSWILENGLRRFAMAAYVVIELVLMTALFAAVQARWPGRAGLKGMGFGLFIGGVWALGFLTGWAFMGTSPYAELLNGALDLPPLMLGGWMVGRIIGNDVPATKGAYARTWPAAVIVAAGYLGVHTLAVAFLAGPVGPAAVLLTPPQTLLQYGLLGLLGLFVGTMYVVLRPGLRHFGTGAAAALFAFGVFGQAWAWFQLFFVIEFAAIAPICLLLAGIDCAGVFVGVVAYELLLGERVRASSARP